MVTTFRLAEGVASALARLVEEPEAPDQLCEAHTAGIDADIHVLRAPPDVPIRIGCRPAAAVRDALRN